MNKYRAEGSKRWWRAVLTLAAATVSLGVVGLGASAASAATPTLPFGFAVSGTASLTGSTVTLDGAGLASSLGIVSYKANGAIISDNPTTGAITDTLTETLTAANGSTVTIFCQQVATPISSGVYNGIDHWTVTGGTGTYRGATGSGVGDTHVNLNLGTFAKVESGTITP